MALGFDITQGAPQIIFLFFLGFALFGLLGSLRRISRAIWRIELSDWEEIVLVCTMAAIGFRVEPLVTIISAPLMAIVYYCARVIVTLVSRHYSH